MKTSLRKGYQTGYDSGYDTGYTDGEKSGFLKGEIKAFIEAGQKFSISKEDVLRELSEKFSLIDDEANKYMDKYWKR